MHRQWSKYQRLLGWTAFKPPDKDRQPSGYSTLPRRNQHTAELVTPLTYMSKGSRSRVSRFIVKVNKVCGFAVVGNLLVLASIKGSYTSGHLSKVRMWDFADNNGPAEKLPVVVYFFLSSRLSVILFFTHMDIINCFMEVAWQGRHVYTFRTSASTQLGHIFTVERCRLVLTFTPAQLYRSFPSP